MQASGRGTRVHCVRMDFTEGAFRELRALGRRTGRPPEQVLRDAIALSHAFDSYQREGYRILVENKGRVREIIPR